MSIARPYLTAQVNDQGHLVITADDEAKEWIREERERDQSDDDILWSGFEGYWNNGSYWPFDAGRGNPMVGLTSAPCIAEGMDVLDDGTHVIEGRLWWYPNYMVRSPVDELVETGRTIFSLAT